MSLKTVRVSRSLKARTKINAEEIIVRVRKRNYIVQADSKRTALYPPIFFPGSLSRLSTLIDQNIHLMQLFLAERGRKKESAEDLRYNLVQN